MIYVLTYAAPHKKTQDLLLRLKAIGKQDVVVVATPWEEKKSFVPLIPHRPSHVINIMPQEFCKNLCYEYIETSPQNLATVLAGNITLIAGAGILTPEVVASTTIINSHPAWLPEVRGLDALKWAIYKKRTIGVTSHIISNEADAGLLIEQQHVPLYTWDTFHSIAMRQYDIEIDLLARSMDVLNSISKPLIPLMPIGEVHRRMPHALEMRLYSILEVRLNEII